MPTPVANLDKLDQHLTEVVRALYGAIKTGISHTDDPKIMDASIKDCKEILDEIMAGKVQEWIN